MKINCDGVGLTSSVDAVDLAINGDIFLDQGAATPFAQTPMEGMSAARGCRCPNGAGHTIVMAFAVAIASCEDGRDLIPKFALGEFLA